MEVDSDQLTTIARIRVQAVVIRYGRILMVQHRQSGESWWCLPGGGWQPSETYAEGALRELEEECRVKGRVIEQLAHLVYGNGDETISFLVEIGNQNFSLGYDPEVAPGSEILSDVRWMALAEIPERDRAYLWASGLLAVQELLKEIEGWGNATSYPGE